MFKLQGNLPREIIVAFSGGVDSVAVVDFLRKNHIVTLLYINHGTEHGDKAESFVRNYDLDFHIYTIDKKVPKGISQEEHWRNQRYKIFHKYSEPVITCHHLDDCVETWIWSSLHGEGKIIPYSNRNVIRPFRLNKKQEFTNWSSRRELSWVEDPSNKDIKYTRNFIRHELLPKALVVNPGLYKVIRKKVQNEPS